MVFEDGLGHPALLCEDGIPLRSRMLRKSAGGQAGVAFAVQGGIEDFAGTAVASTAAERHGQLLEAHACDALLGPDGGRQPSVDLAAKPAYFRLYFAGPARLPPSIFFFEALAT